MPSILITGVSGGIGLACANLFAEQGFTVAGTLRDTSRVPTGLDSRVRLFAVDLAVPGSAGSLAERVLEQAGCPDIVLNNAGVLAFGALEDVQAAELERLFQINVFGQLELVRGLLPAMRERRSGVIANVTSLGGTMTFPFFSAYNATKWALEGASEGLWHELKPFGIRVKLIEPGFVETPIWSRALPAEGVAAEDASLGRIAAYRPYLRAMLAFERTIAKRSTPEQAAAEIAKAFGDASDRLRYPVAAYARSLVLARRAFGAQALVRFMHTRWMGPA